MNVIHYIDKATAMASVE